MNNEPVAWMRESDKAVCSNEEKLWFIEEEGSDWNYVIPLYTHPANPYQSITDTKIEPTVVSFTCPAKEHFEDEPQAEELHEIMQSNLELTDEEILISAQYNGIRASEILDEYVIDFARTILRKASEK